MLTLFITEVTNPVSYPRLTSHSRLLHLPPHLPPGVLGWPYQRNWSWLRKGRADAVKETMEINHALWLMKLGARYGKSQWRYIFINWIFSYTTISIWLGLSVLGEGFAILGSSLNLLFTLFGRMSPGSCAGCPPGSGRVLPLLYDQVSDDGGISWHSISPWKLLHRIQAREWCRKTQLVQKNRRYVPDWVVRMLISIFGLGLFSFSQAW